MEPIFNSTQFSTKFTTEELEKLNEVLNILKPDFNGTKTEAFKLLLNDYFQFFALCNLQRENLPILDQVLKDRSDLLKQLASQQETIENQIQVLEQNDAAGIKLDPHSIVLKAELFTRLQIIAFLAVEKAFIKENSIPELIEQILLHYQSTGYFLPTVEETETVKIKLGI